MKDLYDLYWELHGFEGLDLDVFLQSVKKKEHGEYTAAQIKAFLLRIEEQTIENIETKAAEAPQFAFMKDEVLARTTEEFAELRRKYAD